MYISDFLPLIVFTILVMLIAPLMTCVFVFIRFKVKNKSMFDKCLISILTFTISIIAMYLVQRYFPFTSVIWFMLYFIVISILTFVEYKNQRQSIEK